MKNLQSQKLFRIAVTVMAGLIILTRVTTLTHNMFLHPDEYVFFTAAESLKDRLIGDAESYEEVKRYPEGGIVMQLPFRLIAEGIERITGKPYDRRLVGRISAVVYFTLGSILGCLLIFRYFVKDVRVIILYGVLQIFSLFHIEQSRYGTWDPVSFFLLMAVLLLSASGAKAEDVRKERTRYILASAVTGVLGAVKYPLVFFGTVPGYLLYRSYKNGEKKGRVWMWILCLGAMAAGFLIMHPGMVHHPAYVYSVIVNEFNSYVINGNIAEVGGPLNHVIEVAIFHAMYSGLLMAPVFLAKGLHILRKNKYYRSCRVLTDILVPIAAAVFFIYNLFARTLVMRTYYPFFCIADIYTAIGLARIISKPEIWKKAAAWAMMILTIARGGAFLYILANDRAAEEMNQMIAETVDETWMGTTRWGLHNYSLPLNVSFNKKIDIQAETMTEDEMTVHPGELVITMPMEYFWGQGYFIPVNDPMITRLETRWQEFTTKNKAYYVGKAYPDWYYWVFSYWLKGTTGSLYEFPTNYVYYGR